MRFKVHGYLKFKGFQEPNRAVLAEQSVVADDRAVRLHDLACDGVRNFDVSSAQSVAGNEAIDDFHIRSGMKIDNPSSLREPTGQACGWGWWLIRPYDKSRSEWRTRFLRWLSKRTNVSPPDICRMNRRSSAGTGRAGCNGTRSRSVCSRASSRDLTRCNAGIESSRTSFPPYDHFIIGVEIFLVYLLRDAFRREIHEQKMPCLVFFVGKPDEVWSLPPAT